MLNWVQKNALTVIALVAYFTMSVLMVAQSRVIESQRTLIKSLYSDSLELTARKVHDIQVKRMK